MWKLKFKLNFGDEITVNSNIIITLLLLLLLLLAAAAVKRHEENDVDKYGYDDNDMTDRIRIKRNVWWKGYWGSINW